MCIKKYQNIKENRADTMEKETKNNEPTPDEQTQTVEKSKKSKRRSKNKKSLSQESSQSQAQVDVNEEAAAGSESILNLPNQIATADMLKTLKALKLNDVMEMGKEAGSTKVYKFWNTQPVPKINETTDEVGEGEFHKAIEPDKTISEIKQDSYALPEGFVWDTLDLNNEVILKELYTLLNENYVEDDDAMFRFDYQPEFLRWALQPPQWRKEWLVINYKTWNESCIKLI